MLAVVKAERGRGVVVREVPPPTCGDQEVIIEVRSAGICGSDLHAYESLVGFEWMSLPVIMDHEVSGAEESTGSGTGDPSVPIDPGAGSL